MAGEASPRVYYQFEFSESGLAEFSLVEAGGRVTTGRRPKHRFSVEGKRILFGPPEWVSAAPRAEPPPTSLPPALIYVNRDKLIFQDGGFVLYRVE